MDNQNVFVNKLITEIRIKLCILARCAVCLQKKVSVNLQKDDCEISFVIDIHAINDTAAIWST